MNDLATSHGILMSGKMICAYKMGLKTQTRRTRGLNEINQAPNEWTFERFVGVGHQKRVFVLDPEGARFVNKAKGQFVDVRLPYGSAGDSLWFRETWKMYERDGDGRDFLHYRADDEKVDPVWWTENDWTRPDPIWHKKGVFEKWQPSMFMPKLCCRFRGVDVVNVRLERLQDISENDAINEGLYAWHEEETGHIHYGIDRADVWEQDPRLTYRRLWELINGAGSWELNPWVWVYEFSRYSQQVPA